MEDNVNLIISILSLVMASISAIAAAYAIYRTYKIEGPYVFLEEIFFKKEDFKCFTDEVIPGYKKITKELLNDIYKAVEQNKNFLRMYIDEEEYLVANFLRDKTEAKNIRVILAPYQLIYSLTAGGCNKLRLKKVILEMRNKEQFSEDRIDYKIEDLKKIDKLNIKIAYICKAGDATSILFDRLKEQEDFKYTENNTVAKDIIVFQKERCIIECENNSGSKYYTEIIIDYSTGNYVCRCFGVPAGAPRPDGHFRHGGRWLR